MQVAAEGDLSWGGEGPGRRAFCEWRTLRLVRPLNEAQRAVRVLPLLACGSRGEWGACQAEECGRRLEGRVGRGRG